MCRIIKLFLSAHKNGSIPLDDTDGLMNFLMTVDAIQLQQGTFVPTYTAGVPEKSVNATWAPVIESKRSFN